jgi:hypothetical protein
VEQVFPAAASAIWAATQADATREQARVWAFLQRVEAEYFPVFELDEYAKVVLGVPFARYAWTIDRWHELDVPTGQLMLLALCAQPYAGMGTRIPLLDAVARMVPAGVLAELPEGGFALDGLRARLAGTTYAAAADFAAWAWGEVGSVFLDLDDDIEVSDADWTPEVITELTAQWRTAAAVLDRIDALAAWLEQDPPAHFAQLLDAAHGRDGHLTVEQEQSHDAIAITEAGIDPVARAHATGGGTASRGASAPPVPLSLGGAG